MSPLILIIIVFAVLLVAYLMLANPRPTPQQLLQAVIIVGLIVCAVLLIMFAVKAA